MLAGWVLLSGLFHWLVTDLFELTDGEGRSTGPERLLVVASICAKAALVLAGVLRAQHGVAAIQAGHWLPGLASHATAVALLTYCYVPAAWVERLARMRREVSFAHAASTDAVLFLRSFTDDNFRLYTPLAALGPRYRFIPGRKRFEEFLSAVLYSTAELVAVGRPGERLPTLGGSRTYWATDAWQEAIRSTASRTHALIVMAGRTPSLAWELGQLREMSLLGKTLVVFPPDGAEGTAERYRFVTDALRTAPVHRLPPELLHALTAVAFDATGTPVHYLSCGRDWSSYTTSLLHYFGTLRGTATFEDRSALTAVTEWVEDPFAQAAYLLDRREHALARAIVAEAISARSDADALLGAAWFAAEVEHDHPEARRLLEEARRRAPDAPEVTQAVALLDGLERGAGDPRALLRLRWPEVLQSRPDPLRQGNVKLRGLARMQLVRGIQQWAIAHEAEQYDDAAEHAGELRDLGEQAGNPTVVAFAMCCLGDSLAAAGDLDDAETAYSTAAGLRAAPRVPLAPPCQPWTRSKSSSRRSRAGAGSPASGRTVQPKCGPCVPCATSNSPRDGRKARDALRSISRSNICRPATGRKRRPGRTSPSPNCRPPGAPARSPRRDSARLRPPTRAVSTNERWNSQRTPRSVPRPLAGCTSPPPRTTAQVAPQPISSTPRGPGSTSRRPTGSRSRRARTFGSGLPSTR